MIVPRLVIAEIDLHHADAALAQSLGNQAAASKLAIPVALPRFLRLPGDVGRFRSRRLHAEGDLRGLNRSFKLRIVTLLAHVIAIHCGQQVELLALYFTGKRFVANVLNELVGVFLLRVEVGPLVNGGEKCRAPKGMAKNRQARTKHYVTGQIRVLGTETISKP